MNSCNIQIFFIFIIGDEYVFESSVRFECDDGYNLVGSESILCLSSGDWSSEVPECVPVDCGTPPLVQNANILTELNSEYPTTFLATFSYECFEGYEAVDENLSIHCQVK